MSIGSRAPSAWCASAFQTPSEGAGRAGALALCAAALLGLTSVGCARESVHFEPAGKPLSVRRPALYPETVEYNRRSGKFMVSSIREGLISEVDAGGGVSTVVDDPRLCSVLGIAIDAERGRLWAVNSDLGASSRPSAAGPKNLAAVGVYDLSTGAALAYVDLAPLSPGAHLLNGIALDPAGNAYVTDSFSPVIYRVDPAGAASVFWRDERFLGDGINLNGLVVHPDGYLLVVKKSDGALFRVPLADPSRLVKVAASEAFVGGDGLILVGKKDLVIVANQVPGVASNAAFSLSSDDGWLHAKVRSVQPLGDVYPTTGTIRDGTIYVIHSKLGELLRAPPDQKGRLREEATIVPIGKITP